MTNKCKLEQKVGIEFAKKTLKTLFYLTYFDNSKIVVPVFLLILVKLLLNHNILLKKSKHLHQYFVYCRHKVLTQLEGIIFYIIIYLVKSNIDPKTFCVPRSVFSQSNYKW